MFGFSSDGPRLNGQLMLAQQMQGLNQNLAAADRAGQPPQAQPGTLNLPKAFGQVQSQLQKLGLGGAPQTSATAVGPQYDPSAVTMPAVAATPATGAYDPGAMNLTGAPATMAADAGAPAAGAGQGIGDILSALFA